MSRGLASIETMLFDRMFFVGGRRVDWCAYLIHSEFDLMSPLVWFAPKVCGLWARNNHCLPPDIVEAVLLQGWFELVNRQTARRRISESWDGMLKFGDCHDAGAS
jgi:hypothetical protein